MLSIFENEIIYKLPSKEFLNKEALLQSHFITGKVDASIVVFYRNNDTLLDENKYEFLSKMLQAVKVNITDILLINHKADLNLIELNKIVNAETIFLFDINPLEVGVQKQTEFYKINTFNNFKYVFGEDLGTIEKNVNSKKAIWAVLKSIFEI